MKLQRNAQYSVVQLGEDASVLLDKEETAHLEKYQKRFHKTRVEPEFREVEPKEDNPLQLVYGVLIPQIGSKVENWEEEIQTYKEYAHGTMIGKSIYMSCFNDIALQVDKKIGQFNVMPCALLLNTSLDFKKVKSFAPGYTMYLLTNQTGAITNVLNRHYLFCLCETEPEFDPASDSDWKESIQLERLEHLVEKWK